MIPRETIVQVVKVEHDTSRIEEYERLKLLANRAPARGEVPPGAAIVHVPEQKGIAWASLGLGFATVVLLATGLFLLVHTRFAPAPMPVIVHVQGQPALPSGSNAVSFHWQALGRLEVVTLWSYPSAPKTYGIPSGQLCFVGPQQRPGLPIAMDGMPLEIDTALAARLDIAPEDIERALPLCTWHNNHRADDITVNAHA